VTDFGRVLRQLRVEIGDALTKRERARSFEDFAKYRDDPVGFLRDVLKCDPWWRQEEIAELVTTEPLVVVASCNSCGKDWLAARLALWWVYARRGLVLLTAPTERQLKTILMGHVRSAFHGTPDLPGELFETALKVDREGTQAGILCMVSTDVSHLTGYHAASLLAILTEAQAIGDHGWEAMLSCGTGEDSRLLALGNPLVATGRFYEVSRAAHWQYVAVPATDHPNVAQGREVIPGGPTQAWVELIAQEFGRDSSVYRARVLAEFPEDGEDDALVSRGWLEHAAASWESGALESHAVGARSVVGVDVARFGTDFTSLAIRQGPVLRELLAWHGGDLMATTGRIGRELQARGLIRGDVSAQHTLLEARRPRIIVDEIGLGGGVLDRLVELRYDAKGFCAAQSPSRHVTEKFTRKRDEAFWCLRTLLEEGCIALPRDEMLFEELLALRWRTNSNGKIEMESKMELRKRLGRSPDRADAVAMCFSAYSQDLWAKPFIGGFLATL
jgi:hypothetical protein